MANMTIVVPCAVLGSICAVMFVFIWWWFPRAWNKGNKGDTEAIGLSMDALSRGGGAAGMTPAERRRAAGERAREYLEAIEARNKARAEGRDPDEPLPVYTPHP
jgi:hypothetical protein